MGEACLAPCSRLDRLSFQFQINHGFVGSALAYYLRCLRLVEIVTNDWELESGRKSFGGRVPIPASLMASVVRSGFPRAFL
jgi:hypothetical protein